MGCYVTKGDFKGSIPFPRKGNSMKIKYPHVKVSSIRTSEGMMVEPVYALSAGRPYQRFENRKVFAESDKIEALIYGQEQMKEMLNDGTQ